jgi:SAM-dependent methyltransferase
VEKENTTMEITFKEVYHRYYSDYEPYNAFLFHAQEELAGVALSGKTVLEIGCGRGAFAVYMALAGGAHKVIALDEAEGFGADKRNVQKLQAIIDRHEIVTIEIMKADITASALFSDESFDLIVSNFAIHHSLHAHRKKASKDEVQAEMVKMFLTLNRYLRKGGLIVLREMSGINFWRFMPYRWKMSHIDWDIHPSLGQWLMAMRKSGFTSVRHAYLTPFFLSRWPSRLVRNRFANFFCSSSFYLYGTK